MSLWLELKRRNVIRLAVAYAVVAWVLVQVAATVFPALQLPEWTVSFVAVLLMLGFPVALVLSWVFVVTPEHPPISTAASSAESRAGIGSGTVYTFDDFVVDAQRRVLARADGEPIALTRKAFETLLYFVARPGQLLDKRELIEAIWPNVIVEENNLNQTISVLRRTLGEFPGQHRFIVTEPGRGYRFVASVRSSDTPFVADADRPGANGHGIFESSRGGQRKEPLVLAAFAILAAVVLLAAYRYVRTDQDQTLPNSVAVLPLESLGPPDTDFYADGMHVEIISQLTKLRGLNVIVRESVLPYAVERPPLNQIAADLRVKSILTGSFQYVDGRIQVTVQLVDPTTNTSLWSDDYREDFSDIFSVQSDIAMSVANALAVEFSVAEQQAIEARPTESEDAYRAYLRAESLREVTGRTQLVLDELNEAIRLDPNFALAHARKADWYSGALISQTGADAAASSQWSETERQVRDSAATALSLDPETWQAHMALAGMHRAFWRWTEAQREYALAAPNIPPSVGNRVDFAFAAEDWLPMIESQRRTVELNPNSALEHWVLGLNYAWSGNRRAAVEPFQRAVDLAPTLSTGRTSLAMTEIALGNDTKAIEELRIGEDLPRAYESSLSVAVFAYAYSRAGRTEDAQRLVRQFSERRLDPRHHAGTWALVHMAAGDYARARESLETVIDKIANEEPDAGFIAINMIRWNFSADPMLERPPFRALRDQLRGH